MCIRDRSKEPLAPASDGQDQKLADAMRWVVFSLISAEEQGITKSNIDKKVQIAKIFFDLFSFP